jgi:hypothetical protein
MKLKVIGLVIAIQHVISQQFYYHREFHLIFNGKLPDDYYQTIFSADGTSYGKTLSKCTNYCVNDQRCVGLELCQIKPDLFRCRVCCEWKKLGNHKDPQPGCKYLEMVITYIY